MKPIILPYKLTSESGRLLAKSLNTKRVRPDGNYKYKENDLIINLGYSSVPLWDNDNVAWMNKPENVAIAVCKKKTLDALTAGGVLRPDYTQSKELAIEWINQGAKVVCREILNGHSAAGIVMAETVDQLSPNSKLFVKYFPKKNEYRVHVIRDKEGIKIFDFILKKKKEGVSEEEMNYQIRNYGQWIFCRQNTVLPDCVKKETIKAAEALNLDLCSVDICYSVKHDKCVVLELNTSSSLSGETTLERYTNAINDILNDRVVVGPPELNIVYNANRNIEDENVNLAVPITPPVVQPPISAPVAPARIVQNVIPANENYSFAGVSNISIKKSGGLIKVSGEVAGIGKIKVMEIVDGRITFYFKED